SSPAANANAGMPGTSLSMRRSVNPDAVTRSRYLTRLCSGRGHLLPALFTCSRFTSPASTHTYWPARRSAPVARRNHSQRLSLNTRFLLRSLNLNASGIGEHERRDVRRRQRLGFEQPDIPPEQPVPPAVVNQLDAVHVFHLAVAGRQVLLHDFDGHNRTPHRERQRVYGPEVSVLIEQFGDVEVGRGVDVAQDALASRRVADRGLLGVNRPVDPQDGRP